jgi:D-alanyl-D-alanine carboxypeptidase
MVLDHAGSLATAHGDMPDATTMLRALSAATALLLASPAAAQLCDGSTIAKGPDGRVLGHLPYGDVADSELVEAPAGFAVGQKCFVRREVLPDLTRLLAAAASDPATGGQLRGLSCHRSIARQTSVFCRERADPSSRAISSAPPGHSEHATGYVIDFAVRPANGCPDAEACMAATPAFRWLVANARRYGFEMSFPASNKQGVKWEPWHWRWAGVRADAPGAVLARARFARARAEFPANPAVVEPVVVRVMLQPPAVALPAPAKVDKRRKRRL